jgi:hypothetical protein
VNLKKFPGNVNTKRSLQVGFDWVCFGFVLNLTTNEHEQTQYKLGLIGFELGLFGFVLSSSLFVVYCS